MSGCRIDSKPSGIYNIGNNCYLNSGLQILASCDDLVDELNEINIAYAKNIIYYLKDAFDYLLNKKITYEPSKFIKCFSEKNNDFILGTQCCSQNFIRTLIRNINEECIKHNYNLIDENEQYTENNGKILKNYQKFIKNIYPESKIQSLFSGITKSHSKGECPYCHGKIDNYSYNFFIDQIMYLDGFEHKCKFSDVLKENLGFESYLTMGCPNPKCKKEIEVEEKTKIIKLPEILIFTLERYQGSPNRVKIEPDKILEMNNYIDKTLSVESTSYELFAINIRFGSTINYGHEICQVKRDDIWYEIDDSIVDDKIKSYNESSYGLFYRRIKKGKNRNLRSSINSINQISTKSDETKINVKESQQKLKDSQLQLDDCQQNLKVSQQNLKVSQQNLKVSQLNLKDSQIKIDDCQQNLKVSQQNLKNSQKIDKDSQEKNNGKIINNNNTITGNSEKTSIKQSVNNIDINKNYGIETIYILKEVIINNIENEEIFTQFISFINKEYPNLEDSKCSQEIIINILNKLKNFRYKYKNHYNYDNKAYSIFDVSLNYYYSYECRECYRDFKYYSNYNRKVNYYKVNYYKTYNNPEFLINLPTQSYSSFRDIVFNQFELRYYGKDKCKYCHEINKYLTIKIDKLPKILIFTLKKKDKNHKIMINPDDYLTIPKDFYNRYYYQLFALNILKDEKSGCECQIKINNKWYEIRNNNKYPIDKPTASYYITGLFYKKI